jgi:hypothetical protein
VLKGDGADQLPYNLNGNIRDLPLALPGDGPAIGSSRQDVDPAVTGTTDHPDTVVAPKAQQVREVLFELWPRHPVCLHELRILEQPCP